MIGWGKLRFQYQDDIWNAIEGTISGICLSVLSGLLLSMCFPPVSLWFLAWVGLIPMLYAQHKVLPPGLAWAGPSTTFMVYLGLHFRRVSVGFTVSRETLDPVMAFIMASKSRVLLIIGLAVAVVSLFQRKLHEDTGLRFLVAEPVLFWVALDAVRDMIPALGTSAAFAYSQHNSSIIMELVPLVGTFGLTGLIVLSNASLCALIMTRRRDNRGHLWYGDIPAEVKGSLRKQGRTGLAVSLCFLITSVLMGVFRTGDPSLTSGVPLPPRSVRVGAVQPGRDRAFEKDCGLGVLRELSLLLARAGAKVIVWPEACFPFDPRNSSLWEEIQSIAQETGAHLVVPYFAHAEPGERGKPRFVNEGLLVSPGGEVLGAGAKDHPVSLLGETSVSRGSYQVFPVEGVRLGIMICYDLNFTDTARRLAGAGASLVLVPSNDWQAVSQTQWIYTLFRAAENGISVVKADSTYDSCIVSHQGKLLAQKVTPVGSQAALIADVPVREGRPPAFWLNPLIGKAAIAGWVVLMGYQVTSRLRDRIKTMVKATMPKSSQERLDSK